MRATRWHPNRNTDKILYSKPFLPKIHRTFVFQRVSRVKPLGIIVLVAFKPIGFEGQNQVDTGMFVFTVSSSQLWTLLLSNGCRNIRPKSVQDSYRIPTLHIHQHHVPKLRMASFIYSSILVAARSKACVCGRSNSGIVGSNPSGSMDVCLL